ncbi:MAG: hypothetical protein NTU47_14055 [Ignavibacteriales bacterium]|nr:hypothetical protein [Ignavibacteriales bacterium]
MSIPWKQIRSIVPDHPTPVALESICSELSHTGRLYLSRIASVIDQVAPSPGRIVHLHTTKLAMRLSGLQPVVFSAIDATTYLQVAQVNLAMTSAAALSFVEYVAHSFPFTISEIRTRKGMPFHNPNDHRPHRDFPALIGEQGYAHSFVENHSSDALFSITSKMQFRGSSADQNFPASAYELQRDLNQFLFFHNNFRFVPWLEGKTPIQKLKTFRNFQNVHSFGPPDGSAGKLAPIAMRSSEFVDG